MNIYFPSSWDYNLVHAWVKSHFAEGSKFYSYYWIDYEGTAWQVNFNKLVDVFN